LFCAFAARKANDILNRRAHCWLAGTVCCWTGLSAFQLVGPQVVQVRGVIPLQVQNFTFSSYELHEIPRLFPLQTAMQ